MLAKEMPNKPLDVRQNQQLLFGVAFYLLGYVLLVSADVNSFVGWLHVFRERIDYGR